MTANDSKIRIEDNVLKGKRTVYGGDCTHFGKLILEKLEKNADFVGQIDPVTEKKNTFREMRERSIRCALWMKAEGLMPGDVVVICSHNQLDNAMPCFAALYLGAIISPWDAGLNRRDFCHLIKVCRPKMIFTSENSAATISDAAKEAETNLKIIVIGKVAGFVEFEEILGKQTAVDVKNFKAADLQLAKQTAMIGISSGTTGLPKGVALSHAAIPRILAPSVNPSTEGIVGMVYSSLHWLTGSFFMFWSVIAKTTNVLTPPFEEEAACSFIEKWKVNWVLLAPNMVNRLVKSGIMNNYDLSSVRVVLTGGSPLSVTSKEAFGKYLPNAMISSFYGITECGGTISSQGMNAKPGSCGHIIDNAELKVVDPDTGKLLGPNEKGELYVKTANMMNFYHNNPEATAEAIDQEGFLHTGDLGYYDENGEIFIVDRLKELIKYCNYQISPNEIESVLLSHPGVKEAVVVGLPHPEDGEHPIAYVIKSDDYNGAGKQLVTETDLVNLVAAELSDTKQLRGGVRFVDSLPKTPSDKVLRKIIKELAKSTV